MPIGWASSILDGIPKLVKKEKESKIKEIQEKICEINQITLKEYIKHRKDEFKKKILKKILKIQLLMK